MESIITPQEWQSLADGSYRLDEETLRRMEKKWPYFVWPALLALEQDTVAPAETQQLRTRIALAVGDREALERVLDPETDFEDFYPDMQPVALSTNDTIDAFLNRFGSDNDKETDLITRLIFDPATHSVADVEYDLEEPGQHPETPPAEPQKETAADATASRIDAFLAASSQPAVTPPALMDTETAQSAPASQPAPTAKPARPQPQPNTENDKKPGAQPSQLTLSLVHLMIRNQNYTKALEILNKLNFDNTEKSTIFADQIRFLKKLIINQNHRNQ